MKRQPVQSSNLKSVGYATDSKELHVEFKGGKVFKYLNVSEETHKEMLESKSIGSYFARKVRNAHECEAVNEEATENQDNATS